MSDDMFDRLPASEPVTPEAKKIGDYIASAGFTVKYLNGIPVVRTPPLEGDKARLLELLNEQGFPTSIYAECVIVGPPS